jgi:hypothetical protein
MILNMPEGKPLPMQDDKRNIRDWVEKNYGKRRGIIRYWTPLQAKPPGAAG